MFIVRLFSLVLCTMVAFNEVKAMQYTLRGQEFLETITNNGKLPMFDNLMSHLRNRVSNSVAEGSKRAEELKRLDYQWVYLHVFCHLDTQSEARFAYYFALMTEEHYLFRIHKDLGCYAGKLTGFEQSLSSELELVTEMEFTKKVGEKYSKEELTLMKLEESRKMAEAILEILAQPKE